MPDQPMMPQYDPTQALVTLQNMVVALGAIAQKLATVLPQIQSTATSATAGTNGAVPSQVAGYINTTLPNGTAVKIAYFLP